MTPPGLGSRRLLASQFTRYSGIVMIGLVTDVAVALAILMVFAAPLPVATAGGFLVAMVMNYVLFELYLFHTRTLSWKRLLKISIAAQGGLMVRITSSLAIGYFLHGSLYADAIVLCLSIAVSFTANFFIIRFMSSFGVGKK